MFSLNNFIMKTLKGMIGNYPDFQVMEYALNWYEKGKLTEEDLAEIETLIESQHIEPPVVEDTLAESENSTEITDETTVDEEVTTEETETPTEPNDEAVDTTSTNEEVVEETE